MPNLTPTEFKELSDKFIIYLDAIKTQIEFFHTGVVTKTLDELKGDLSVQTIPDIELGEYSRIGKVIKEKIYEVWSLADDFDQRLQTSIAWRKQYRSHKAKAPSTEPEAPKETLASLVSQLNQQDLAKLLKTIK